MSAEKQKKKIDNLMTVARKSTDESSLWEIAAELEHLSAWAEAREVERMAEQAQERRMAEAVR